ncbi:uncharacterized protein LOC111626625 [Centruroides sculpturatus]|uniref:uncharacterized protein LOC111626625 n=1 Tax=Centruroides sculpturatus TaxID=218467 RepID=UPI000C6CD1BE|nr:uncharacterized protein LOC111626625 [Centruroides sculpturatus]
MNDNPYGLTLEMEQHSNTRVHFLDLDIRFDDSIIRTSVFRKPTNVPAYIPVSSCDPFQYKMAAFRALVKRAYTHSSTQQALTEELNYLESIARSHGYRNIIQKIAERHKQTQASSNIVINTQNTSNNIENRRIPIKFNPLLKSLYNTIAKQRNVNIAYRRCSTLFDILRNEKDGSRMERISGVYKIPIRDNRFNRDLVYVGSTKRSLEVRLKEHISDIQHNRHTTSLSTYATDPEIVADFNAARIIASTPHIHQLKWLEEMEIFRAYDKSECINSREEISLSMAWKKLLHKE